MSLPTPADITADLAFFDDWEERYQYIIDLGKELPSMADDLKTSDRLVKGCQSSVWMAHQAQDGQLHFSVDSDAVIVRGLLALVLAAFQKQTPQAILAFDVQAYFAELDLERHLSPTRGNGLRAIVQKIRALAQESV